MRIAGPGRSTVATVVVALALLASACSAGPPTLALDESAAPIEIPSEPLAPVGSAEVEGILAGQRGTPVVINVWASWCAPCRAEAPLLQRAHADYDGDVTFIGIASSDRPKDASDFLERFEITYPNLLDDRGEVTTLLEMTNFPTTYVFGRDGMLRAKVTGGISERKLAAVVDDALRN